MSDRDKRQPEPDQSPASASSDEISKKEVLRETGISYGQFYRWKRMGLIPEGWFKRRATFTGQETFLPRQKILQRVQQIQSLKDSHSLEEIAQMLSPDAVHRTYRPTELEAMTWISSRAHVLFPGQRKETGFRFVDVLCLTMIERLLKEEKLTDEQIRLAASTLIERFGQIEPETTDRQLAVVMRDGVTLPALHDGTCLFPGDTKIVASVNLNELIEEIKIHLRNVLE